MKKYFSGVYLNMRSLFVDLSKVELILLGNQKSGTSAISKLLSLASKKSVLLDTPLLWQPYLKKLLVGELDLEQHIKKHKRVFNYAIIKEPNLTFLFDNLQDIFPQNVKYGFIVRDPRDNIRSLLNRMSLPGNLENISAYEVEFNMHEQIVFDSLAYRYKQTHYIAKLAERWNIATKTYFNHRDKMLLIKYEDFCKQKSEYIYQLASQLAWPVKAPIEKMVDVQYQPAGYNKQTWEEFYGKKNLEIINKICEDGIKKLGYPF